MFSVNKYISKWLMCECERFAYHWVFFRGLICTEILCSNTRAAAMVESSAGTTLAKIQYITSNDRQIWHHD